jgi:outer membrane immunogenic protein
LTANSAAGASGNFDVGQGGTFIGGVQIGYNWQFGAYLAGIETDFQGVGRGDTGNRGSRPFPLLWCGRGHKHADQREQLS